MDDHYQTPLISQAIKNAARNRKLTQKAIFHSGRGSNYMSAEYGKLWTASTYGAPPAAPEFATTMRWPSRSSEP